MIDGFDAEIGILGRGEQFQKAVFNLHVTLV
jgi:hypothetical protein